MKKIFSFCLLAVALIFSHQAVAQTADQVVEWNIKAMGGRENLNAVKTRKMVASMEMQGIEMVTTIFHMLPNFFRTETNIMGKTAISAFNGIEGWSLNPMTGRETVVKMTADEVKSSKEQSHFHGSLFEYKSHNSTIELAGEEDVDGAAAYHIKLTTSDKDVIHYYIDKESHFVVKQKMKMKMEDGSESESEVLFSNFQTTNGITMAHSMENVNQYMGQTMKLPISIKSVEYNMNLDLALFQNPEQIKK